MKELEKRLSGEIVIQDSQYTCGLIDLCSFLFSELETFLEEEGRYFGITKSYMNSINSSLSKIYSETMDEDIEIYERILFLYKPCIVKEFRRLCSRRLSPGDAVIVLSRKILEICVPCPEDFKYSKELKTIRKIIDKFWDNIKNNNKKDSLYILSGIIKTYKASGQVGKFGMSQLNLTEQEPEKTEFTGSGVRISETSDNIVGEVIWTGE